MFHEPFVGHIIVVNKDTNYAKINLQQLNRTSIVATAYSHGPIVKRWWNYARSTY